MNHWLMNVRRGIAYVCSLNSWST
ncbi:hypothetical protein MCP1_7370002 [Candidatus Terasakiella magnetica]|nr:hypothetical protein MCP1_7370002 [Candidatus Terasakiella magnetica]